MSVNTLIHNKLTDLAVDDLLTTKRDITRIILHCTADKDGVNNTVESIRKYHVEHNHWDDIGYHFVIYRDGSIHLGRPIAIAGAHCKDGGNNPISVGVSYVGGLDADGKNAKDTRTPEQKEALYRLVHDLLLAYPGSDVRCHNEFANKACPSFKIETFREEYDAWLVANDIHDVEPPADEPPATDMDNSDTTDNEIDVPAREDENPLLKFLKLLLSLFGFFRGSHKQ